MIITFNAIVNLSLGIFGSLATLSIFLPGQPPCHTRPRSGLLLARLLFVGALSGPLPPIPRISPGSGPHSSDRSSQRPLSFMALLPPASCAGSVGSPFIVPPARVPRPGSQIRAAFVQVLACPLPFGLFTLSVWFTPHRFSASPLASAAPGHNSARGPFASF